MGGRETGNIGSMVREEETGAREKTQRSSQELNFILESHGEPLWKRDMTRSACETSPFL